MQRYNIFFPVHKGLRALLYETSLTLQHTNFADAEEEQLAIQKVTYVIDLFEKHAHTEDNYILPAIAAYEPSVVDAFEQEHVEDHELGRQLTCCLENCCKSITEKDKTEAGNQLAIAFTDFTVFNLKHMAKEEKVINHLLWNYYSDAELHAITQQIISQLAPQDMAEFSKWMIRGMNSTEIANWLRGVKNTAPKPLFSLLFSLAEQQLPANRWNMVRDALTEGAMVA